MICIWLYSRPLVVPSKDPGDIGMERWWLATIKSSLLRSYSTNTTRQHFTRHYFSSFQHLRSPTLFAHSVCTPVCCYFITTPEPSAVDRCHGIRSATVSRDFGSCTHRISFAPYIRRLLKIHRLKPPSDLPPYFHPAYQYGSPSSYPIRDPPYPSQELCPSI